jgi:FtsZ-interacting cell division protein YlmF
MSQPSMNYRSSLVVLKPNYIDCTTVVAFFENSLAVILDLTWLSSVSEPAAIDNAKFQASAVVQ